MRKLQSSSKSRIQSLMSNQIICFINSTENLLKLLEEKEIFPLLKIPENIPQRGRGIFPGMGNTPGIFLAFKTLLPSKQFGPEQGSSSSLLMHGLSNLLKSYRILLFVTSSGFTVCLFLLFSFCNSRRMLNILARSTQSKPLLLLPLALFLVERHDPPTPVSR